MVSIEVDLRRRYVLYSISALDLGLRCTQHVTTAMSIVPYLLFFFYSISAGSPYRYHAFFLPE
jgi:hypothetical protein